LVRPNAGRAVNDVCIDFGLYSRTKEQFKKVLCGTVDLVVRSGGGSSSDGSSTSNGKDCENDNEDEFVI
jgi:hypothetical protein